MEKVDKCANVIIENIDIMNGEPANRIRERLSMLRESMKDAGVDYYLIPTADFHNSEYVSDYFKVREYFSNFTGSNGTLLVWQEGAGLWTDGRYFIQAEKELAGTTVELFRMQEDGVPTVEEFLKNNLRTGQVLGVDGRVLTASDGKKYEELLKENQVSLVWGRDLAESVWPERPEFPAGRVWVLSIELSGKSVEEKLRDTRAIMQKEGAEGLLLTKLDDLMWLFNIRGCDVECNPVAMCYGYITEREAFLFLQKKVLDEKLYTYLEENEITVKEYTEVANHLQAFPAGQRILVDTRYCNYALYRVLAEKHCLIEKRNPTEHLKAVKNPVELANMERIYLKDSVAVTKFIYWLKSHIGREEITEISAADRLEQFRREIPEFMDLSFPTIAGYGSNGAVVHYRAEEEQFAVLRPEGFLVVDSGGQYLGGTTDITRTIALGSVTEEQRMHYTLVVAGMLRLASARWLHGCTGRNLDILARQPMWSKAIDYKHGTGHGIGYLLNVHEGPQNIRWRFTEGMTEAVIEAGMVMSDEPGIYIEGSHGIRVENIVVAQNDVKNEYGQFMHFENLTWVPLDKSAIDESYLSDTEKNLVHSYQKTVYEKLAPYLNPDEREWLKSECSMEI